ncbi:MAG TPA: hypothetical protein VFE13_14175 [Caulobacteraceae bacterium]|nr:hypothetical protein [Caulobacteraceae bacterium]
MRKITVFVPVKLLTAAQDYTAKGVSETVREGLEQLSRRRFYERMRALRGKVKFDDFNLDELRRDREFDEHGNVVDRG